MAAGLRARVERRIKSFGYAFAGWRFVLQTQANARIHAVISVGVMALALWLEIGRLEWVGLILTLMIVWMAEFTNTAIEVVVDLVMPDAHPLAKAAKDVAAATVLVGALGAIVVGLLILAPPLWQRLGG